MNINSQQPDITPAPKVRGTFWRALAATVGLVGLVGIAYGPSFGGGFVWDDLVLVKNNPLATGAFTLKTIWLGTDFPLSTTVTWLEWLAFRENATGYRIVNALLHASSVLLLWRLLIRLAVPGAWLGAAVFAVHPVAVASVAWISELKNTLSLPFFLLSLLAFLEFEAARATQRTRMAWGAYGAAWGCFVLALLAKTSTVVLPILLLGGLAQQRRLARKEVISLAPFFATAVFFGAMTIWFQAHQAIRGLTVQTGSLAERLADAGTAIWFYLGKALLPVNLCAIYPSWEKSLPGLIRFLPLGLLIAALALGWHYRNRWGRFPLLAGGAFIVVLLPVCGLVDMYFMVFARVSDHFAYLALLVVAAAVGGGIGRWQNRRIAQAVGLVIVTGLVLLSQQRARVYASDEALWQDTIQKNPQAWSAHNNLACNLAERGQLLAAMEHFAKSLEINPANAEAQRNLAKGLVLTGRFPEAEPHFRRALELKPDDEETLTAYGQALANHQRLAEAITQIQKAVAGKPKSATRLFLAALLAATGQTPAAATEYQIVLKTEPKSIEALNNLAWILATATDPQQRDGTEAVRLAREACKLTDYQQPVALGTLAAAYAEAGDFSNAVATAESAIRLASASGNESLAERNRKLLRMYQAGKSYGWEPQGKRLKSK